LSYFNETFPLTTPTNDEEATQLFTTTSARVKELIGRLRANYGEEAAQLCRVASASVSYIALRSQLTQDLESQLLTIIKDSAMALGMDAQSISTFLDSPVARFETFREKIKAVVLF